MHVPEEAAGDESYGHIAGIIAGTADLTAYSRDLLRRSGDDRWAYHLSYRRHNLLESIAELFDRRGAALELGAGCGAVTRWLGERFRRVDAIEAARPAAVAARLRTRGMENVRIYCGDPPGTTFEGPYSLISLAGVDKPSALLSAGLAGSLCEDGILVLAFGNGTRGPDGSIEFLSRERLASELSGYGLRQMQFYHVFPDHGFAETIIAESDEIRHLKPYNWIKKEFGPPRGMPGHLLLKEMVDSAGLWRLPGSLLALASRSGNVNLRTGWLINKFYNNEAHDEKFHHRITLERAGSYDYVVKRAPIGRGQAHVDLKKLEFRLEDGVYVPGELLSLKFFRAAMINDGGTSMGKVTRILHDRLILDYATGGTDREGYPLVKGDAMDYTFWNLVVRKNGELSFIDKKWRMKNDIPADFVLFRNFYYVYDKISPFLGGEECPGFIVRIVRRVYPRYSLKRFRVDLKYEEEFQSLVSNRRIKLSTRGPAMEPAGVWENIIRGLRGSWPTRWNEARPPSAGRRP